MECIYGRQRHEVDRNGLLKLADGRAPFVLDVGTGDGRFVRRRALADGYAFIVGLDACRENLRTASLRRPPNSLFVIANSERMPVELTGLAGELWINFPWGSLLDGLLSSESGVWSGLRDVAAPASLLTVNVNEEACGQHGFELEDAAYRIGEHARANGWRCRPPEALPVPDLRQLPSSWARRLQFGRSPRSMTISGTISINGATTR